MNLSDLLLLKSLIGTINTEPINTKIKLSHLSKTYNEDSILDNIDTEFGSEYELVKSADFLEAFMDFL